MRIGITRFFPTLAINSILVFENYPNHTALSEQFSRLRVGNVRSIEQTTYPLTIAVTPGQQINLKILYDPAQFAATVIHSLLNHLRKVLESVIADPNQRLSTVLRERQADLDQGFERRSLNSGVYTSQTSLHPPLEEQGEQGTEQEVSTPEVHFVPPGNSLEKYLVQLWKKLLKTDQVGIHDSFFELGGDSLTGAICIYQLHDALQETIPLTAIFDAPTVFELARYLEQKHPDGVAQLFGSPTYKHASAVAELPVSPVILVPIQPKGIKPPLFCIHPAGGVVFPYYALAPYLGKDQSLYGIQDPGLYDAQSAPKSIEAMATRYLEALKTIQPEGPYHLLGWSVGGVVAYEMAQQLSRQGQSVAHLIMLDTHAPARTRMLQSKQSYRSQLQHISSWAQQLPARIQGIGSAVKPIASYIHSGLFLLAASKRRNTKPSKEKPTTQELLSWAGLNTWRNLLLREAEVANTVSQDASLLLVEMPDVRRVLELVREHRRLARRYVAEAYRGRITLIRATQSGSDEKGDGDPMLGWGVLAQGAVDIHVIQTNHIALLVKPYVEILAQELRACLDQCDNSLSDSTDTYSQPGK